jgi:hypothetical protein
MRAARAMLDASAMKQVDPNELEATTGGMKWRGRAQSYNVEDRRPGAPPLWQQKLNTWWTNVRNGHLW